MNNHRLQRFEEALDRYGPELERWPLAERAAAATLLVTDAAARAVHAEAKRLQGLLGSVVSTAPLRPGAAERILAGIAARRAVPPDPLALLARPRAAMALTAVAVMMFALGAVGGSGEFGSGLTQFSNSVGGYSAMSDPDDTLPDIFEGN
jgi:hypothetical protein